jgi:hypothetical protein
MMSYTCTESPYSLVFAPEAKIVYYLLTATAKWSSTDISLILTPEDDRDSNFVRSLRGRHDPVIVSHSREAAIAKVVDVTEISSSGATLELQLKLRIVRSDFTPQIEMNFSSTTADQFAELRARRLLLNENPALDTGYECDRKRADVRRTGNRNPR